MANQLPLLPASFSNSDLEKAIKKQNPLAFNGLSAKQKAELLSAVRGSLTVTFSASMQSIRVGPMPTPEDLEKYKLVDPSFPSLISGMATKEQTYSHARDEKIIALEFGLKKRGQIFALIITLVIAGGGLSAILLGHEISGTIFGGAGLVGLVALFLKK